MIDNPIPHNTLKLGNGMAHPRWMTDTPRKLRVEMSGDFTDAAEAAAVLRDIADGLEGKPGDRSAMQASNCPFAFLAQETSG